MIIFLVNQVLVSLYKSEHRRFIKQSRYSKEVQEEKLFSIIDANSNTEFGRCNSFDKVNCYDSYREKVNIMQYEDYSKYISKIASGESNILTSENVKMFEPTSGSSSKKKLIPYTDGLKMEFLRGIKVWIYDLFSKSSDIKGGFSYWSITPIVETNDYDSVIPVAFEEDSSYFGKLSKKLLDYTFCVPSIVKKVSNIDSFRYVTLLFLLKRKNLRLISIWNPSYLILLTEEIPLVFDSIVKDIELGTINELVILDDEIRKQLNRSLKKDIKRSNELRFLSKECSPEDIWPHLRVISCWADGNSKKLADDLQNLFPKTKIQPKGLLSTEAFSTFPFGENDERLLSINSHFFEFIKLNAKSNDKKSYLAHELDVGEEYIEIITTSGGLYRYNTGDVVKCVGYYNTVPKLQFVGKERMVSDFFGEKLNEVFVKEVIKSVSIRLNAKIDFNIFVLEETYKSYVLFSRFDSVLSNELLIEIEVMLDERLRENFHYDYCRKLGQLESVRIIQFKEIAKSELVKIYQQSLLDEGMRLGDIKDSIFSKKTRWLKTFDEVIL